MATRKSVSHYKIMDYWRDKEICKDGKIITEDEAERRVYGIFKQCCWDCKLVRAKLPRGNGRKTYCTTKRITRPAIERENKLYRAPMSAFPK